jgi:urease accessory protein
MSETSENTPNQNFADGTLEELQLFQLADSALPIGSLAHSFGIETLVSHDLIRVENLAEFLAGYLEEAGLTEAVFCRDANRLAATRPEAFHVEDLLALNDELSALKPARESRAGSMALGNNLLQLASALGGLAVVRHALSATRATSRSPKAAIHHAIAFGLVAGAIGVKGQRAIAAYLHQSVASLVSACQRLMPLGQTQAARILWDLKPLILRTAEHGATCPREEACCFLPLLDWGAMEHPALATRLFIS